MPASANILRLVRSRYRSRWRKVCSSLEDCEGSSGDEEEAAARRGAPVAAKDDDEGSLEDEALDARSWDRIIHAENRILMISPTSRHSYLLYVSRSTPWLYRRSTVKSEFCRHSTTRTAHRMLNRHPLKNQKHPDDDDAEGPADAFCLDWTEKADFILPIQSLARLGRRGWSLLSSSLPVLDDGPRRSDGGPRASPSASSEGGGDSSRSGGPRRSKSSASSSDEK
jgi:hypothetical protein